MFGPTAVGSAAANPPILIGGTVDGTASGAVSVLKVLSGTGFINCANCSGSGISVGFAGPIGSVGTPGGFKDGGGNFQPLLGDTSFGQWMNIKQSVALSVTGTCWQTTQPVSSATMPSTPVNAQTYTSAGYPWFDLYDEDKGDINASEVLQGVKSVAQKDKEHGFTGQQDDTSFEVPDSQVTKYQTDTSSVRDRDW